MTAVIHTNHRSNITHARLSNYKRTLMSVFDKKKVWDYLTEERSQHKKIKKLLNRY